MFPDPPKPTMRTLPASAKMMATSFQKLNFSLRKTMEIRATKAGYTYNIRATRLAEE